MVRDELHLRHDRILADGVEERRKRVEVTIFPAEGWRQIEPEAVDAHLGHPVAQRIHDHPQRRRVGGVQ